MQKAVWCLFVFAVAAGAQFNVTTYQYGNARTGLNPNELQLSPATVNASSFGELFSDPVDGQIYGQPLYISGLAIPGSGTHNVVFAATEHDSVYAFDADSGGAPLWSRNFLDPANGVTTIPYSDVGCAQIAPEIGITGTPVIDLSNHTLYVVAMTKEASGGGANYVARLHALDLSTGAEKSGSPVVIQASVPGTGDGGDTDVFVAKSYKQRPALLLLNGVVYIGWSSHCDLGLYHGWLMGYDENTLQQVSVYNDTPDSISGSFWNGGAGPSADAQNNIFIVAANGAVDGGSGGPDLGESVLKLSTSGGLSVADWFIPYDYPNLIDNDLDLGSSGAALLPDEAGSAAHPHLLVTAGKNAKIYLLDRDNLGKLQSSSDSQIVQSIPGAIKALFGNPAYFNSTVYFAAVGDNLKAFPLSGGLLATTPSSTSAETYPFPGAVPSISANGNANGIVWTIEGGNGGTLHAYDAANLASELYNSNLNASDHLGGYVKFSVPLIANGKVYAGTSGSLAAYGLLDPPPQVLSAAGPQGASPGSLISIYGSNLAQSTASAAPPLPSSLGGASVQINGTAAPMLYASAAQINAQVPYEIAPGMANVVVTSGSVTFPGAQLNVLSAAPQVFTIGTQAAAQNQDGSLNTPSNPASAGSVIAVYCTGLGAVSPAVATGGAAPQNPPASTVAMPTVSIGGQTAQVFFAGLSPGSVGLYQVNVQIPPLATGNYPLIIAVGGAASSPVTLSVSGT